jgi:DNA polymerase-3 subunit gamma/tau
MAAMAAIYQRARPATFAEVIGQEHVKDVLAAALRRGRASHAYLFSGPRGVGKTTTARLLAMALNCEADGDGPKPCGQCDGCRMVREGHHPDVMELDAASNNSVDDVRELREKTSLASMRGGSRVWILDEAHMLSRPAANALLKTLEEPPPGLVFVLATTEPEKLPPTVLSRCQHFRFRRLSEAEITGKLERLCNEAGVEAEQEALALVARAADGAMRDAESLLERLLTPGSAITLSSAEEALGLPPVHRMQRLAAALAEADLATLLAESEALYRDGFAPRSLAENLGVTLRDALREEVTGSGQGFRLPLERPDLLRLIHALDDEQERFIRRDDLYSLEVALIKGVNALSGVQAIQHGVRQEDGRAAGTTAVPGASSPKAQANGLPSFDPTGRAPRPLAKAPAEKDEAGGKAATSGGKRLDWHAVRTAAGPQLKAFLMPARESVEDGQVIIRYGETHKFHFNEIKKREDELARLIEQFGGPGYRLRIEGPGEHAPKKS